MFVVVVVAGVLRLFVVVVDVKVDWILVQYCVGLVEWLPCIFCDHVSSEFGVFFLACDA